MKLVIQLFDRTLSVKEDGVRAYNLGNGAGRRYESVQDAVKIAIAEILRNLNFLKTNGDPDFDRFPELVDSGQVELELHGHRREAYVAALHLWAAYGVPTASAAWCPDGSRAARIVEADKGSCFYDTYRFESDVAPIERLAKMTAEWGGIVATAEGNPDGADGVCARVLKELGVKPGLDAGHRPEHIRIGVLGVTGAGKSTFINALLQRYVAPSASTICSAVVVEFVEAESRAKEGFEVTFLPQHERTQRIKRESASCQEAEKQAQKLLQMSHAAQKQNEAHAKDLAERLAALEAAEARVKNAEGRLLPLSALPPFVSLVPGDRMVELVSTVKVRLAHPLLKHVVLVDTPGLRDPDDLRRRIAIDVITKLDGWLYLAEGNTKINTSVAADLREIREQANHPVGAIVLTKVDHIGSKGRTIQDDAKLGLGGFSRPPVSWNGRSFWCAARAPAMAAEYLGAKQDTEAWATLHSEFEKHGVLNHVGRMGDPYTSKPNFRFKPARRLMELLEKASEEPPDVDLQRGLLDYFLDASFVPATARGLADVVNEQAIIARVSRGRHLLQEDISRRVRILRNSLNANLQHLANIDSIEKMSQQWDEFQCKISILANTESEQRATRDSLFSYAKGTCAARTGAVATEAAKLREQMKADLRTTVEESSKWEMSGPRTYSIFDTFDAKLAAWCSDQIRELWSNLREACARYEFIKQNALEVPYTLHRQASDDDQINDYEKFLESFETTISRMQQQADRKSKRIEDAITHAFQEKLNTIASSIHQAASIPVEHTQQQMKLLESKANELKSDIEKLEAGIPGSKDLLKARILNLETTIDTMEVFQKALTACETPIRQ